MASKACRIGAHAPVPGLRLVGRDRPERILAIWTGSGSDSPDSRERLGAWQARSRFAVTIVESRRVQMPVGVHEAPYAWPAGIFDAVLGDVQEKPDWLGGFAGVRIPHEPRDLLAAGVAGGASLETACEDLDRLILDRLQGAGRVVPVTPLATAAARHALVLVHHRPRLDPRLGWMSSAAPAGLLFHQLGVHEASEGPVCRSASPHGIVESVPRQTYVRGQALLWGGHAGASPGCRAAVARLAWMEHLAWGEPGAFSRAIGAWRFDQRPLNLQWMMRYLLDLASTLLARASCLRGVDCIVAADILVLPAALVIASIHRVPVVFDAHEYWPEADLRADTFEKAFWQDLEASLLPYVAHSTTVSTGLAELMESEYGVPFSVLPNAVPLAESAPRQRARNGGECEFLVQGVFAPGRGVELLIQAWPDTAPGAKLVLRGPDNEFKAAALELARSTGLLGTRIVFPDPVAEAELVGAAAQADVGLLPYEPIGNNHVHCCPNKLSQYMAAGLPILANRTEYVAEILQASGSGLLVDFCNRAQLVEAVDRLTRDSVFREELGKKGHQYFVSAFHWEGVSGAFYARIAQLCPGPSGLLVEVPSNYGVEGLIASLECTAPAGGLPPLEVAPPPGRLERILQRLRRFLALVGGQSLAAKDQSPGASRR